MRSVTAVAVAAVVFAGPAFGASPIPIVAAENFYGDVATQIGGNSVKVTSILSNPDQDPHLFEASPSVARAISGARITVTSGADYDPWMEKLLAAAKSADRKDIVVADLVGKKSGDNPHIWYDPATMEAYAKALTDALVAADLPGKDGYEKRRDAFLASLKPIEDKIGALKTRLAGTPVTATEPVFGYMFDAMGMKVRNGSFQLAVMNNTEPSASDVAAFEDDLKTHKVKLLVFNSQASDPVAQKMEKLAKANKIPIVGANETEPNGKNYQAWIASELEAVDKALPERDPVSAIQFDHVSLNLGGRSVLAGVTLDIGEHEFIGVFGPNGAGKTTLMRAILGLIPVSGGSISVLGHPPARGNASIGYMPQSRSNAGALRLSGWDFVAGVVEGHRLGLPLLGKQGRIEVEWALDQVGAQDLARRPLLELSGGERQRLLLAQAIIGRPRLVLLDEPLISLDPRHQRAVVEIVKSLQTRLKIAVLFTSHELNPLLGALDRVLYLGRGQAALGTVDDVITSPVLSRLYGSKIDVVRLDGRIFVMADGSEVERDDHRHEDDVGHGHSHSHEHEHSHDV